MLHLVAFPPARKDLLTQLSSACSEGDVIVLLDAGAGFCHDNAASNLPPVPCHVLASALERVGITSSPEGITRIGAEGLVDITESQESNASWYP